MQLSTLNRKRENPARNGQYLTWLKKGSRQIVANGLYHTGLMRAIERFTAVREPSKFGILCYHRVGTEGVPLFSHLEPKLFEAQMRYVRRHYRVVSLGQLCRELQSGDHVPPTVAITFDDGYRDLYTFAFPVLQKYNIPATIYLIARCMETGEIPWYDRIFLALSTAQGQMLELDMDGPRVFPLSSSLARARAAWEIVCYLRSIPDLQRRAWCATLDRQVRLPRQQLEGRMLSWKQVRTMHDAGISFGTHTMSHPVISQLEPIEFQAELVESRQILENGLGISMPDFAYPFGKAPDWSAAAEEFLMRSGCRSAVTTCPGYNTTGANPYQLLRLQVEEDQSMADFAFDLARLFLAKPGTGINFSRHPLLEHQWATEEATGSDR